MAVGLRNHDEEVEQLQALGIVHVGSHLTTALHDSILKGCSPYPLLLVEQLAEDFVALLACHVAEVLAQHVAHQLHLGVHHPAVGPDDVRSQHKHGEQETVTLPLIRLLTAIRLRLETALSVECALRIGRVYRIYHVFKQAT